MEIISLIICSILIILIISILTTFLIPKKKLTFEERLYKIAGFEPYKAGKVQLSKPIKKQENIYFQLNNGCILYSLINGGYLDEKYIPSSMKFYKNHNYSKDDKTKYEDILKRILSLIDLAQLWINIGGIVPYKEKGKEISLEEIKNKVFDVIKKSLDNENKKDKDILPAYHTIVNNERFMPLIGSIPIKPILLKDCEFSKNLEKLNLKSAIDKGYIKENDIIFITNHFIVYKGIINESKKYYVFHDSKIDFYRMGLPEIMKDSIILYDDGVIQSDENSPLLNLEETEERTVGILKLLFL